MFFRFARQHRLVTPAPGMKMPPSRASLVFCFLNLSSDHEHHTTPFLSFNFAVDTGLYLKPIYLLEKCLNPNKVGLHMYSLIHIGNDSEIGSKWEWVKNLFEFNISIFASYPWLNVHFFMVPGYVEAISFFYIHTYGIAGLTGFCDYGVTVYEEVYICFTLSSIKGRLVFNLHFCFVLDITQLCYRLNHSSTLGKHLNIKCN